MYIFLTAVLAAAILGYSLLPTAVIRMKNFFGRNRKHGKKVLYLTFDDGPEEAFTPKLLDLLKKYDIHATFFVVTGKARENPRIIERMQEEGHLIGFHSQSHRNALFESPWRTSGDFRASGSDMDALGIKTVYFRPPWGCVNLVSLKNMKKRGLRMILWSVMAGDWSAGATSEIIRTRLISRVKDGSIICLHDGRGRDQAPLRTISALEKMLPLWKLSGYSFMRIDEESK